MTPQAQRVALATLAGWSFCNHPKCQRWHDPVLNQPGDLPDYLNDLNAVHELENTLLTNDDHREAYAHMLSQIIPQNFNCGPAGFDTIDGTDIMVHTEFDLLHSTAAQRCEALLRTLGKWTEDEPSRDSIITTPTPTTTPTPP